MWHIIDIKCEPFEMRRSMRPSGTNVNGGKRLYSSIYYNTKTKISSKTVYLAFTSKFICSHLYLLYHLSILSFIFNYLQKYYLQLKLKLFVKSNWNKLIIITPHWTTGSSVKSISGVTEVFCKKGVLKNFTKFNGKHLCQSLLFNKVAGLQLY